MLISRRGYCRQNNNKSDKKKTHSQTRKSAKLKKGENQVEPASLDPPLFSPLSWHGDGRGNLGNIQYSIVYYYDGGKAHSQRGIPPRVYCTVIPTKLTHLLKQAWSISLPHPTYWTRTVLLYCIVKPTLLYSNASANMQRITMYKDNVPKCTERTPIRGLLCAYIFNYCTVETTQYTEQ